MRITINITNREKSPIIDDFKCALCGECCRAGYEVRVQRDDAVKWMNLDKLEILDNIIINPECISIDNKTEINSEEGITVKEIKKLGSNIEKRLKELIRFIQKSHLYYGKGCERSYTKTIIPDVGYDPVFTPKSFKSLLIGLDFGLKYIIRTNKSRACTFLKLNKCSIHKVKPLDCQRFPYNEDGYIRKDYPFLSICNGLQRI